ncbi:Methyltransf_21 domain-containing protein [Rubrivivax sp. A210]|uniref:FkbM family methyltransferase n=1 Tax=Rubrivivax sp. A210 TaxID=2772301 RepID=UPI001917ED4F|nr:FkbM family methyltransferase [Rubrivivax sp. A210]CAD5372637.1 Methyltransf_21 domain-containing protein [Rubrivivax sp. A210]
MLDIVKFPVRCARSLLRKGGIEIRRRSLYSAQSLQLVRMLEHLGINLVLDVGANAGQYGAELRRDGYRGRIVSFEPLAAPHRALEQAAQRWGHWQAAPRMALGATEGDIEIHVAGNSVSSSILDMLSRHERVAPESAYVSSERVPLRRLDGVAGEYLDGSSRVLLKIDTQGYEEPVLAGAAGLLHRIAAIQVELSLVPLYADQRLFDEMRAMIGSLGFELFAVLPGLLDERTGQTLQLDGFFVRKGIAPR